MIKKIKLKSIEVNPHQTRIIEVDEGLKELAESIKEENVDGAGNSGLIQLPDVVSVVDGTDVKYILVSGERRFRAFEYLNRTEDSKQWGKIPVIVSKVFSEGKGEELDLYLWKRAGKENSQRLPLKPIEKAKALEIGVKSFKLSLEKAGKPYGLKNRGSVRNYLNLLELPEEVQSLINVGNLTVSHGKWLYSLMTNSNQKINIPKLGEAWFMEDVDVTEAEKQVKQFLKEEKEQDELIVPDWVTPAPEQDTEQEQPQQPTPKKEAKKVTPVEKTVEAIAPYPPTMEQPNPPCPSCGVDHIAGTNGGERWCLECGGRWASLDELKNHNVNKEAMLDSFESDVNNWAKSNEVDNTDNDTVEVIIRIKKSHYATMLESGHGYDVIINHALDMYLGRDEANG